MHPPYIEIPTKYLAANWAFRPMLKEWLTTYFQTSASLEWIREGKETDHV